MPRELARRARPLHLLTVFDIYMRAGMLCDTRAAVVLRPMDSCRISWGEVVAVEGAELVVERPPLKLRGGKLKIGAPERVRVLRQIDGCGFTEQGRPGGSRRGPLELGLQRFEHRGIGAAGAGDRARDSVGE